jgi:dihydrofolate synthase
MLSWSGPTRKENRTSEAQSYANLAMQNSYFSLLDGKIKAESRIRVEERALDSYYNVLLSLIQFWREFGSWPTHLTIVSHGFKRSRVVESHCVAIGFPLDRVSFIGIDPPAMVPSDTGHVEKQGAMKGSLKTVDLWGEDPHGTGPVLAAKRSNRNPWRVSQALLLDGDERERSRLATKSLDDGGEILDPDGLRPWMDSS